MIAPLSYRSLLVPLDGSGFGEHALPPALGIARRARAAVHLAQVHQPFLDVEGSWPIDSRLELQLRGDEDAYLDGACRRVREAASVNPDRVLLDGPITSALVEHAQGSGADLVVLTTHGRGPLSRLWLGSVSDGLLRRAPCPVLLVRPDSHPARFEEDVAYRHILVPLDGSPLAEKVLGPALGLGRLAGARYTLVRVIEPVPVLGFDATAAAPSGIDLVVMEELQRSAADYLHRVADRLRDAGAEVETRLLVSPAAVTGILELAQSGGVDLIALATHGRGGISRLLLGSVADKLVRSAHLPVLAYRPPLG